MGNLKIAFICAVMFQTGFLANYIINDFLPSANKTKAAKPIGKQIIVHDFQTGESKIITEDMSFKEQCELKGGVYSELENFNMCSED